MVDDLKARLRRLLPVSWDNETDGHGEPTHAVLTFGEHQTQAITLCPDDWMVLNEIPDRIEKLEAENARLKLIVQGYVDPAQVRADLAPFVEEINSEPFVPRATLSDSSAKS